MQMEGMGASDHLCLLTTDNSRDKSDAQEVWGQMKKHIRSSKGIYATWEER